MHATYPLLDPETLGTSNGRRGFAAWMHVSDAVAGPRRYVHRASSGLVLYDGTAVDPSGRIAGHDAGALEQHWSSLDEHLEGRFTALRIDERAGTLEVVNDPFGVHQTFVYRSGTTWWIANSVRLLVRVAGVASIDLAGMAQCIGMYWPGGDRTLIEGITAFPAGSRWRWTEAASPERTTHAPLGDFARSPKRSFDGRRAADLAESLGRQLDVLGKTYASLQCPITAGRDSRVLTALMVAGGVPGEYFTAGDPDSRDVVVGGEIARRLGLPHTRVGGSGDEMADAWDTLSRQVVRQHDGMVTLAHARNALLRPAHLERVIVQLYGAGGERGRGKLLTESFVVRPTLAAALALTLGKYDRGGSLLRPEARQVVREHIERTCRDLHDRGFAPADVPDAFVAAEHNRRWVGSQARQIVDHKDVVIPFVTRPYMRAAFATPAVERLMERVPYNLLRHLSPELHAMPFQRAWPPQDLGRLALGHAWDVGMRLKDRLRRRNGAAGAVLPGRKNDRLVVMERLRTRWREQYLDRQGSSLWQLLDRERFEFLTSDRCTPKLRAHHLGVLFQAVTALAYEEDIEAWVGAPPLLVAT